MSPVADCDHLQKNLTYPRGIELGICFRVLFIDKSESIYFTLLEEIEKDKNIARFTHYHPELQSLAVSLSFLASGSGLAKLTKS